MDLEQSDNKESKIKFLYVDNWSHQWIRRMAFMQTPLGAHKKELRFESVISEQQ